MRTSLLHLALPIALLFSAYTATAQQSPSCATCVCALPNPLNTATNFFATAAAHNTQLPAFGSTFFQQNAGTFNNRFHRAYFLLGSTYDISLCGNTANTVMYITSNTATPLIFACDDDGCGTAGGPSFINFTPAADGLFRIYVYDAACGTYFVNPVPNIAITITRNQATPPPANDEPCGAVALPMNATCVPVSTNNINATLSNITGVGAAPVCGTPSLLQNDVWFTTTVPASGLIGLQTNESGSLCAGAFNLYTASACNGTFTQLANSCALNGPTGINTDPALVYDAFAAGLSVGDVVYIRYWERNGDENGTYSICAYEAIRPPNDQPCGAINLPVTLGCTLSSFSNENATPLSTATANPTPVTAGCGGPAGNDLWFAVTVTPAMVTNGFQVNTAAGTFNDGAMAWYRLVGGCAGGTFNQIACNNNQTVANLMPRINSVPAGITLVAGETIYIRVWNTQPWVGTFSICATINQPPPNNLPCNAIPLTAQYGCLLTNQSNENATGTPTTYQGGVPNATCGGTPVSDVWYTVVMPPNGTIQLDTQAGTMTNGAMAVYTVASGSCAGGNLQLTQATPTLQSCATVNSQQGPASVQMPYVNFTNAALAGQTLYIRVWRIGGSVDGSFGLCARRTDTPPQNCFYTLNLFDSAGDGWQGSYVRVCVNGVCNNYTVNGATASINIGTNIGQTINVQYFGVGGFQNQNSFTVTQFGQPVYISGTAPFTGFHFAESVDCQPPPAPQSDCLGAVTLCSQNIIVNQNPTNTGGVVDLNASNRGCLSANERQGLWYTFSTLCAGNVAFTINPTGNADYDFAVWGPMAGLSCPPTGPPARCSWACCNGATGLQINAALPTTQGAVGSGFVRHLTVNAGDVYILYIDNYSMNGVQFNFTWAAGNTVCPIDPVNNPTGSIVGCVQLPITLLNFDAKPDLRHVDVSWSTGTEENSEYFEVQRSADGQNFAPVGRVNAAGSSQQRVDYKLVDEEPLMGLSFYRLKQMDHSGMFVYSDVIPVQFRASATSIEVFPNPTEDRLQVLFQLDEESNVLWRVLDASGRQVLQGSDAAQTGRNRIDVGVERIEPGSYILELRSPTGATIGTARFVKQ